MPDRQPLDVLDAIHSTRSMRYLKPDPIPDEVVWAVLDAAIRGPTGGNSQGWGWVVVRDAEVKRQIGEWYLEGWERNYGVHREQELAGEGSLGRVNFLAADHLARHIAEAPVWIFAVLRGVEGSANPRAGGSIYGAVQNLMLAARAFGVGSTLTALYGAHEEEVQRLLGLPDGATTMGLIPLGYPARGDFSQPRRRPVEEVVHWERWGTQQPRED